MNRQHRTSGIVFLAFSLLSINFIYSQIPKMVDGDAIKKIVANIASDKFQGRESGTEAGIMTEDFFANEFQKLNLRPAGENGTFFYTFQMPFYKVEGDVNLTIGKRSFYYGRNEDYSVERYADGGHVKGEIVFAGYGINSLENKRNDFEGLDLKGKIVLIKRGSPGTELHKWQKYASDSVKAEYCYKNGAAGIMLFEPAQYSQNLLYAGTLSRNNFIKNFPIFKVDERVARYIFQISDNSYINMIRDIDKKVVSFNTGKSAKMSANVTIDYSKKVRNVLAMIPGTDSLLKNEAVIIGGHMDHIGTNVDGTINNGADDNAAGPSVALGIAQAMVKNHIKPLRTIIFACWAGEEKGLLGSKAWCNSPTWNLSKVVVYFNLDMIGLGDGSLKMPGTAFAPEVWKFIEDNTDTVTLKKIIPSKGGLGGSDHNSFLEKGVPAFAGMTSGEHPNYHQPKDDAEYIRADILQFVGDFTYHSADILATSKLNFINETTFKNNRLMVSPLAVFTPTPYSDYRKLLTDKNIAFSLINITEKTTSNDERNFLSSLQMIDSAFKANVQSKQFFVVQNSNEFYNYSNSGKTFVFLSMNLKTLHYNELYCKALMKYGVRFGVVESGDSCLKNSEDSAKILHTLSENGLGIILRNLSVFEISHVLDQVNKPLAIANSDITILTDDIIKTIKSKGHLFVYLFDTTASKEEILANIENIRTKLDGDSFTIAPLEVNDSSIGKFTEIYFDLIKRNMGDVFLKNVFSSNMRIFLSKAIQGNLAARAY